MTFTRHFAGKKAKRVGDGFQEVIEMLLRSRGWTVIPIPNGCRTYRNKFSEKLQMRWVKTPFDFIATKSKQALFFDAKTYERDRIQCSDITSHQLDSLYALQTAGHLAGYIVYFRTVDKISYFSAVQLKQLKRGSGLHFSEGTELGGLNDFDANKLLTQCGVGGI